MTSRDPIQMPACSGEGFDSIFAGNQRQLWGHLRSDSYFYDPSGSTWQPCSLFCQGLQAAHYCFFDVLQSLFSIIALGVTSGKCWTAHNVAALFGLLKNNLEIHDSRLLPEAKKAFERSKSICSIQSSPRKACFNIANGSLGLVVLGHRLGW